MNNKNTPLTEIREGLRHQALENEVYRLKNKCDIQKKRLKWISIIFTLQLLFACVLIFLSWSTEQFLNNTQTYGLFIQKDSIVIPPPSYKEDVILFKIQIGAYNKSEISLEQFEQNLIELNEDVKGNNKIFTLGEFNDYEKALEFLKVVKSIGFSDAFLIAYENEVNIPIKKAIKSYSLDH